MKKILSLLMICSFIAISNTPLFADDINDSLHNFINTTENIQAKYEYPSMKLLVASEHKTTLSAHTPVVIINNSTISTQDIVSGDKVSFSVLNDVTDKNNKVLIKSGAPVEANILFEKTDRLGKSGKITITDFHTTAVDGSYVPLSSTISVAPEDKEILSITLSVLICPLFMLMKGKHAQVPEGFTKTVYTFSDVYIKTNLI